jgi:uncharacterized protein involved in exopolysaccharide biosynthesis
MNEYLQGSRHFVKLLAKWKIHFLIVTLVACAAAIVFSMEFFMPPKYKSFAITYPSNLISYSYETPSEQLLQFLESNDVRTAVIQKCNLAAHYHIDTTDETGRSKLIHEYESAIEMEPTLVGSIEIKAVDTDPKLACDIVNEIINAVNLKIRNLHRDKTKEQVVVLDNLMNSKKNQIDSIDSSLQELRIKYQLLDYDIQSKEVTRSFYSALSSGSRKEGLKDIDVMMRNLEEKGGEFYKLKQTFDAMLKSYNATKIEYDQALSDLTKELTYTNIVSKPFPANKKSYPIRWIIIIVSVLSANLFFAVVVVFMDKLKKKPVTHATHKES